ncbi:MAG: hypothetical protein HAW59_05210 [Betaproteobacteria bacterium]|nr:hypothetical protein [Betaproteobacteria bacterium]
MSKKPDHNKTSAIGKQGEAQFNSWLTTPVNWETDYESYDLPREVKKGAKTYKDLCGIIVEKTGMEFEWAGGLCLFHDGLGVFYDFTWGLEEMLQKWDK